MKLFNVDEETGLAVASPEARMIEPFAQLVKRVRRCDGDSDGRRKIMNNKELAFIHFMGVYDSRFAHLQKEEDKINAVKKLVALPPDWQPDDLVKSALTAYIDLQVTESTPLVESMIKATQGIISYLNKVNDDLRDNPNKFKPKDITEIQEAMSNIPAMQENLKRAKEMLKKEQDSLASDRKGRMLGEFELVSPV